MWWWSELPFSTLNFANIRILLLLFLNPVAVCRAYFLPIQLGKHQNPLLLFRRLMFSTSVLAFSHRNLSHSTQPLLSLLSALHFLNSMAVVRASFLCTQFSKHQDFDFALSKSTRSLSSLLYPHSTWQYLIGLAFALSALMKDSVYSQRKKRK